MRGIPRIFYPLLVLALLAPRLFADGNEAAAWLRSDPRAAAYESVKPQILHLFEEAKSAGVPSAVLADKLKEGASKHVAGDLLVAALRAELDRLSIGRKLLADRADGIRPAEEESALRAISLLLASGTSPEAASAVVQAGSARDPSDTVEALGVLAQACLSLRLSDVQVQRLGVSLLRSRMPQAAFGSVPGVMLQGSARGMSVEEVVGTVVGVLEAGGGLMQMQDRLQAPRGGRRPDRPAPAPAAGSPAARPESDKPSHPEDPQKE